MVVGERGGRPPLFYYYYFFLLKSFCNRLSSGIKHSTVLEKILLRYVFRALTFGPNSPRMLVKQNLHKDEFFIVVVEQF